MEEFYESEVVWPESCHTWPSSGSAKKGCAAAVSPERVRPRRPAAAAETTATTGSMSIPAAGGMWRLNSSSCSSSSSEEEEDEEEMVPPHVMVWRRGLVGKAAYSLCSGHGRTLKGRDLRYFRNAVLRMTGFLEG